MVKKEYFDLYRFDKKDVELRAVRPQWKNSKAGDIATIQCGSDVFRKKITKIHRGTLQKLRQKRNAVFHVDPQRQKREVTGDSCLEVIKSGLAIFYKLIGLPPEKGVIDFQNIAKQMYAAIHAPS